MTMNILFFTISAGEGHNQVANTLANELLKVDINNKIEIIDTFNYINPKLHRVLMEAYIKSIKYIPELYSYFYKKTSESDNSIYSDIGELFSRAFIIKKIYRLISSFTPDVIICTHPIPTEPLCILKRKGEINTSIITTITDYTLHSAWLKKDIDYYILSSELFKTELRSWKIPEKKCKFFGIPVRDSFLKEYNRQETCNELGVKNTFTVLIMGGGLGLGNISRTLDFLVASNLDIQIIVVAGKNKNLYKELKGKYFSYDNFNNIKIYGYSSNIHKIMTVSDIIITKPGGLTITEAITKELPIVIAATLPGQEERNTEFILKNKIGILANTPSSLLASISSLKKDYRKYTMFKENMINLKKPNASSDIVNLILSMEQDKYIYKI